jgi:electron transfer flavoprotein-quinone oxidoreductase
VIKIGQDRYDVIIVGAGPAGSTAAYICAKNNLSVLLIEKGKYPGSKNMFGGVIYSQPTARIFPAYWKKAPLERAITKEEAWFLDGDSVVKMGFNGLKFAEPPYNKFTILRSEFDKWVADQAVQAGARLINSTLVENLIFKKSSLLNKKIEGVILGDGSKIYSNAVIIAEGAIPNLTLKANLHKKISSKMFKVYVKETLALPKNIIEARFNIEKNEGVSIGMVGYPTSGAIGKGGIWTNKNTISIIVGAYLNQIIDKGLNPYQLLYRLKNHPFVKRLIKGSKTVEYKAKVIPKAGKKSMPKLYDDGVLVIGDSTFMIGGEGTSFAMLSAKFAAETISQAHAKNDYSKNILSSYPVKLKNSYIMKKNMNTATNFYQKHSDSDYLITKALNEAAYQFFKSDMTTFSEKREKIIEQIDSLQSTDKLLYDMITGAFHWRLFS